MALCHIRSSLSASFLTHRGIYILVSDWGCLHGPQHNSLLQVSSGHFESTFLSCSFNQLPALPHNVTAARLCIAFPTWRYISLTHLASHHTSFHFLHAVSKASFLHRLPLSNQVKCFFLSSVYKAQFLDSPEVLCVLHPEISFEQYSPWKADCHMQGITCIPSLYKLVNITVYLLYVPTNYPIFPEIERVLQLLV